ncbi:hypothetical protein Tco_0151418 [Tanacetum coccineum]
MLQRKHYVVTGSMCFQVELGRNLKLRLSDSNSLTAVSSRNFNSRDFPHRQPIYKEAVSSHLVLDCAFGGESRLLRSILAGQSTFLIPEASGAKEVNTTIKESSRPERASVFAKRAPGRNLLPHQKPTPLRKVFSTFKKGIYCHINVDVGCDAMDNSLQAVWSNDQNDRRLKRVEVSEGNISIFDTGLGMDDTNIENGSFHFLINGPFVITSGSVRDPSGDELELSPGGSFTKCDDLSEGKTIMPIEFQVSLGLTLYSSIESLLHVNGEDLAEIPSGEVAVTHLNSCNGLEFVLQFRFELNHGIATTISSPGSRSSNEANARLRCVYLPVKEGKETTWSNMKRTQGLFHHQLRESE